MTDDSSTKSCANSLNNILTNSAAAHPDQVAVIDPPRGELSYSELDQHVDELTQLLCSFELSEGDRVGMYMAKSLASVVSLFAILRSGGAYVPVDAGAPASRNSYIFQDCAVRAMFIETKYAQAFMDEWEGNEKIAVHSLEIFQHYQLDIQLIIFAADVEKANQNSELAYILYTSGSTGKPKGVMHSHSSALGFIDWCVDEFSLSKQDRFSSHAPFHFDLSIFDIFVSIKSGASLVLIGESAGKQPQALSELIADYEISIWYSTPSILRLLVEFGRLEQKEFKSLKLILFAGETYPVKQYLQLKLHWETPVFYNLYGPTETNVCTFYRVPPRAEELDYDYFPIGIECSGDKLKILDKNNCEVQPGNPGELVVCGASVMTGYWNLPELNRDAFISINGQMWYRTGDIVKVLADGNINYISRRDRMIKRRGYRVELGEVESVLYRSEKVVEAAAIAVNDVEGNVIIKAFVSTRCTPPLSIIELKVFCSSNMVAYMVPDQFVILDTLPKTSTDKIDYQKLREM